MRLHYTLIAFFISFSLLGQSVEITPEKNVWKNTSPKLRIGKDTTLLPSFGLYQNSTGQDSVVWGIRNRSSEYLHYMGDHEWRWIINDRHEGKFVFQTPYGNTTLNKNGNLMLGGNLGDTSTVKLNIESLKGGPFVSASGIGLSSGARVIHTTPRVNYNELQGVYAFADSANFVNTSIFGEPGGSAAIANIGVMGRVFTPAKVGSKSMGIVGIDAVNATNTYAGEFLGKVNIVGNVSIMGTIAKSSGTFKIDHPQDPYNKYLYHSFVESPEMLNIYNGNITTGADSTARVTLPEYFEALNVDYKYQLTVMGSFAQAVVWEEVNNNAFVIKTSQPRTKVSWQVTGVRNDSYARDNRVIPEVLKPLSERGTLLYNPPSEGFTTPSKTSETVSTYPFD